MENRQNRTNQGVMWGAVLIGLGIVFLLQQIFPGFFGALIWSAVFAVGAVATYGAYTRNKQNWWLLIPVYVMGFIAAIIQIGSIRWLPGEFVGAFVMLAIGFPFLYVYLKNSEHWWALIPAYTMAAIAGIILVSMLPLSEEMVGSFVMFAIAAPFLYVYLHNRQHWWALIPGGIMAVIGVGLFIAGMAWIFPAVMIVAGLYLLYRQFGKGSRDVAAPTSGPAADHAYDTPVREFEPIMAGPEADRPQE